MKLITKLLLLLILTVILFTCTDNPVGPDDSNAVPGRRDYVWTVDTINPGNESLYLYRIWGSSPTNVWAIGSSSWSATSIWHFNGDEWKCDSIPRKINPSALFGVSSNEVWLGNSNSTIWKYDGLEWSQYGEYKVNGFDRVNIEYFDGISNSDIYGVGGTDVYNSSTYKAIIMHYDGSKWKFVGIPETKVGLATIAIEPQSGVLLMSGTVFDPSGFIAKIYCWDGTELKELLSGSGSSFVTKLGDEIYATLGSKIYKYSNKQLSLWKDNSGTGINGNIICGRNRNDFFIKASEGVAHYNGTDFDIIYSSTPTHNVEIMRGTIFEKDVFFIDVDFTIGKNLIVHGRLN